MRALLALALLLATTPCLAARWRGTLTNDAGGTATVVLRGLTQNGDMQGHIVCRGSACPIRRGMISASCDVGGFFPFYVAAITNAKHECAVTALCDGLLGVSVGTWSCDGGTATGTIEFQRVK